MSEERIEVEFRLHTPPERAEALARRIAYEQTVELPEAVVTDPGVLRTVLGRVEGVGPDATSAEHARARISYDAGLASGHLPQLLNLLYGNVSIYPGVRLVDLRLPEEVLGRFPGPRFGLEGLRRLLGVHGRPLLATALKPRGLPVEALAEMAGRFALGGGDIVKDDQNLVGDLEAFKVRVAACKHAVDDANERTGRGCLYLPHVSAPLGEIERHLDYVYALGLAGVLVCPMITGLDTARALLGRYPLLMMAHPALTGSFAVNPDQGIAVDLLLGTLMRLAGADVSIFPSHRGRFSFSRRECLALAERLRSPLGGLASSWPCPAGGMQFDDLDELGAEYGPDSVFLVGGALFAHAPDLTEATRAFAERIAAGFPGRGTSAPASPAAGDEAPAALARSHLPFSPAFDWGGRESAPYKDGAAGDGRGMGYAGVRRVELVGKFGERTRCDLRYFEVRPGGFTSREKHVHTHIIIGARGTGQLTLGNRQVTIVPNDVAYVAPLEAHQLRNEGDEPFGFFCIVDHERDRPQPP